MKTVQDIMAENGSLANIERFQTMQKCAEVGTNDGHGHAVCQIGDDPDDLMTVPAR